MAKNDVINDYNNYQNQPELTAEEEEEKKKREAEQAAIDAAKMQGTMDAALQASNEPSAINDANKVTTPFANVGILAVGNTSNLNAKELGVTGYDELRAKLGCAENESITDKLKNNGGVVPMGYAKEARMALAAEKRQAYKKDYEEGRLSETDYLYKAYGEDLLKAEGIDRHSVSYWKSNYEKNGKIVDPLDSDTFFSSLIESCKELADNEEFTTQLETKTLNDTFTGLISGDDIGYIDEETLLTDTEFGTTVKALAEAMDKDTEEIITLYQAGVIGRDILDPFIDNDNDGEYEYYYGRDGIMYAVAGTEAATDSARHYTCVIDYMDETYDDGRRKVKQVEVHSKGGTGSEVVSYVKAFGEGLVNFVWGIPEALAGIFQLAKWGVTGSTETFINYQAWKNQSNILSSDIVAIDDKEELGTRITRGVGTIAGIVVTQVALAFLTGGSGNVAVGGAEAGAAAGKEAAVAAVKAALKKTVVYTAGSIAAGAVTGAVVGAISSLGKAETSEETWQSVKQGAAIGAGIGLLVSSIVLPTRTGLIGNLKAIGTGASKTAATIAALPYIGVTWLSRFRGGNVIQLSGNAIKTFLPIVGVQFVKDLASNVQNLTISNEGLIINKQLVDNETKINELLNGENASLSAYIAALSAGNMIEPLTGGQILGQSLNSALSQAVVSTLLRSYGSSTTTSRIKTLFNATNGVKTDVTQKVGKAALRNVLALISSDTRLDNTIDVVCDALENMINAGISAIGASAYARTNTFQQNKELFMSGAFDPSTLAMTLYGTYVNVKDINFINSRSIANDKAYDAAAILIENDMEVLMRGYIQTAQASGNDAEAKAYQAFLSQLKSEASKEYPGNAYEQRFYTNTKLGELLGNMSDQDAENAIKTLLDKNPDADAISKAVIASKAKMKGKEFNFAVALAKVQAHVNIQKKYISLTNGYIKAAVEMAYQTEEAGKSIILMTNAGKAKEAELQKQTKYANQFLDTLNAKKKNQLLDFVYKYNCESKKKQLTGADGKYDEAAYKEYEAQAKDFTQAEIDYMFRVFKENYEDVTYEKLVQAIFVNERMKASIDDQSLTSFQKEFEANGTFKMTYTTPDSALKAIQNKEYTIVEKNGKRTVQFQGKEYTEKELFETDPYLYILFLGADSTDESIRAAYTDMVNTMRNDPTGPLDATNVTNGVTTIRVKPEFTNDLRADDTSTANVIIRSLDTIAKISKDPESSIIASIMPLVQKYSVKLGEATEDIYVLKSPNNADTDQKRINFTCLSLEMAKRMAVIKTFISQGTMKEVSADKFYTMVEEIGYFCKIAPNDLTLQMKYEDFDKTLLRRYGFEFLFECIGSKDKRGVLSSAEMMKLYMAGIITKDDVDSIASAGLQAPQTDANGNPVNATVTGNGKNAAGWMKEAIKVYESLEPVINRKNLAGDSANDITAAEWKKIMDAAVTLKSNEGVLEFAQHVFSKKFIDLIQSGEIANFLNGSLEEKLRVVSAQIKGAGGDLSDTELADFVNEIFKGEGDVNDSLYNVEAVLLRQILVEEKWEATEDLSRRYEETDTKAFRSELSKSKHELAKAWVAFYLSMDKKKRANQQYGTIKQLYERYNQLAKEYGELLNNIDTDPRYKEWMDVSGQWETVYYVQLKTGVDFYVSVKANEQEFFNGTLARAGVRRCDEKDISVKKDREEILNFYANHQNVTNGLKVANGIQFSTFRVFGTQRVLDDVRINNDAVADYHAQHRVPNTKYWETTLKYRDTPEFLCKRNPDGSYTSYPHELNKIKNDLNEQLGIRRKVQDKKQIFSDAYEERNLIREAQREFYEGNIESYDLFRLIKNTIGATKDTVHQLLTDPQALFVAMSDKVTDSQSTIRAEYKDAYLNAIRNMRNRYGDGSSVFGAVANYLTGRTTMRWAAYDIAHDTADAYGMQSIIMAVYGAKQNLPTPEIFDGKKISVQNGEMYYDGVNINEAFNDTDVINKLTVSVHKTDIRDQVFKDIKALRDVMYNGTTVRAAENKIVVNVSDLKPKALTKMFDLIEQSQSFREKYQGQVTDMQIKKLQKTASALSKNELTQQMIAYRQFINQMTAAGISVLEIDLNDLESETSKAFFKSMELMGYDNDIYALRTGEGKMDIPGISVHNKTTMAIESDLSYDDVVKQLTAALLAGENKFQVKASTANAERGWFTQFIGLTGTSYITGDEIIDLDNYTPRTIVKDADFSDKGVVNYRIVSGSGNNPTERTTKSGVSGGDLAKTFSSIYGATTAISGANVAKSYNSSIAIDFTKAAIAYFKSGAEFKNTAYIVTRKNAKQVVASFNKKYGAQGLWIATQEGDNVVFRVKTNDFPDEDTFLNQFTTGKFNLNYVFPFDYLGESGPRDIANRIEGSTDEYFSIIDKFKGLGYKQFSGSDGYEAMRSFTAKDFDVYTGLTETAYKEFAKNNKGKTLDQISEALANQSEDFYLTSLRYEIEASKKLSQDLASRLEDSPAKAAILKISQSARCKLLDNIIQNNPIYREAWNNNTAVGEQTRDAIFAEIAKAYNSSGQIKKFGTTTKNSVREEANSFMSNNFITPRKGESLTMEDLIAIRELYDMKDKFYMEAGNGNLNESFILKHDAAAEAFECISRTEDGKLVINMDYLVELSDDAFTQLKNTISKIDANFAEQLQKKYDTYQSIQFDEKKKAIQRNAPSARRYTTEDPNAPTIVHRDLFMAGGAFSPEEIDTMVQLNKVRYLKATTNHKYENVSSLLSANNEHFTTKFMESYMNLIQQKLISVVDKAGHAQVYNMNCREAVAEYLNSFLSWRNAVDTIPFFKDDQGNNVFTSQQLYRIFTEAQAASTGVDTAAEYSGWMIVKLDANGQLDTKLITSSVANKEAAAITELYFGENNFKNINDYDGRVYLLSLKPNTFKANVSGYESDMSIYDLKDAATQQVIYQHIADNVARYNRNKNPSASGEDFTYGDIIKLYGHKLTIEKMYDNLVDTMTDAGIDRAVANMIKQDVRTLSSAAATNFGEEQMNTYFAQSIEKYADYMTNYQLKKLRDIAVHGVTHDALTSDEQAAIKQLYDGMDLDERAIDLAHEYLYGDSDILFTRLQQLKDQGEDMTRLIADVFTSVMFQRQNGSDLHYLLGHKNANAETFFNALQRNVSKQSPRFSVLDPATGELKDMSLTNLLKDETISLACGDLEWLYAKNGIIESNKVYQFGVNIKTGKKMKRYAILNAEVLNYTGEVKDGSKDKSADKGSTLYRTGETYVEMQNKLQAHAGVNSFEEDGVEYIVCANAKECAAAYKSLITGQTDGTNAKVFIGFNNEGNGADNDNLTRIMPNFFDGIQSFDIRKYMDTYLFGGKIASKLSFGESLQALKEKGVFQGEQYGRKGTAHDASSDIDDAFALLYALNKAETSTRKLYQTLRDEVQEFCGTLKDKYGLPIAATKDVMSAIKTDELPSGSIRQDLIDSLSSKRAIDNTTMNSIMRGMQAILESTEARAIKKKLAKTLREKADDAFKTDSFRELIKVNKTQKAAVQNVLINVLGFYKDQGIDNDTATKLLIGDIANAVKHINKDGFVSYDERTELFFTQDAKIIESELKKQAQIRMDADHKQVTVELKDRDIAEKQTLIDNFMTTKTSLNFLDAEDINSPENVRISNILNKTYQSIEDVMPACLDTALRIELGSDLMRMVGLTEDAKSNIFELGSDGKLRAKKVPTIQLKSRLTEQSLEEIKDIFKEGWASSHRWFTMGAETAGELGHHALSDNTEFNSYGTVYISDAAFKKAFGQVALDTVKQYGSEYYTRLWRQPREQKTAEQIVRIVILPAASTTAPVMYTRTTAKSLENGDFDGDFSNLEAFRPSKQSSYRQMFELETKPMADALDELLRDTKSDSTRKTYVEEVRKDVAKFLSDPDELADFVSIARGNYAVAEGDKRVSVFNEKIETVIKDALKAAGADIDDPFYKSKIKDYTECFGFQLKSLMGSEKTIAITHNAAIKQLDNTSRKEYDENYHKYLTIPNQQLDDTDSIIIGEAAKKITNKSGAEDGISYGDTGDMLFHSRITFTEETLNMIDDLLKVNGNQDVVRDNLINIVKNASGILSDNERNCLRRFISANQTLNASTIQEFYNLYQMFYYKGDTYNQSMTALMEKELVPIDTTLKGKSDLLRTFIEDKYPSIHNKLKSDLLQETSNDNIMRNIATMIAEVTGKENYSTIRHIRDAGDDSLSEMLCNAIVKDDKAYTFTSRDDVEVISQVPVDSQDKSIFFTPMTIAVRSDGLDDMTDTAALTKEAQGKFVLYHVNKGIVLSNLSKQEIQNLRRGAQGLPNADGTRTTVDGDIILNAETFEKDGVLLTARKYDLYDSIKDKGNYAKVANRYGKAFKATVVASDISLPQINGQTIDAVYPGHIANTKNLNPNAGFTPMGKVTDASGVEYDVYEVRDMSLVASQLNTDFSVKDGKTDYLGLVQGIHAPAAVIQYGDVAYKMENGVLTFDPTAFNSINKSIHSSTVDSAVDPNATKQINAIKLASILEVLPDDPRFVMELATKLNLNITQNGTKQDIMNALYRVKDLGGEYGDSRVDNLLQTYILNNPTYYKALVKLAEDNPLIRTAWDNGFQAQRFHRSVSESQYQAGDNESKKSTATGNKGFSISLTRSPGYESTMGATLGDSVTTATGYIGRRQFVEQFLRNSNADFQHVSKQQLKAMALASPETMVEDMKNSTLLRGYVAQNADECYDLDPVTQTPLIDKKTGAMSSSLAIQSQFKGDIEYGVVKDSLFGNTQSPTHVRNIVSTKRDSEFVGCGSAMKAAGMIMGDGSDASIVDAMTNSDITIAGDLSKPSLTIDGGQIKLGTQSAVTEGMKATEYQEFLRENMASSKTVQQRIDLEQADKMNKIASEELYGDLELAAKGTDERLKAQEDAIMKLYDALDKNKDGIQIDPTYADIFAKLSGEITSEDDIHLSKICGFENDVVLRKSFFSTVGWDDKKGKSLRLAKKHQQIIEYAHKVQTDILGNEYVALMSQFKLQAEATSTKKRNATLRMVNEYEQNALLIEAYEQSIDPTFIKKVGSKAATEITNSLKAQLHLDNDVNADAIKTAIDKVRSKNDELRKDSGVAKSVQMIDKIKMRMTEVTNQLRPFAMFSWFIPTTAYGQRSNRQAQGRTAVYKLVGFDNVRFMNEAGTNFLTAFDADGIGVLGNLKRVAAEYANEIALNNFRDALIQDGYMRNADVASIALSKAYNTMETFWESLQNNKHPYANAYYAEAYKAMAKEFAQLSGSTVDTSRLDMTSLSSMNHLLRNAMTEAMERCGVTDGSITHLSEIYSKADEVNKQSIGIAINLANLYQRFVSVSVQMGLEARGESTKEFLLNLWTDLEKSAQESGKVLVDDRGCKIVPGAEIRTVNERDADGLMRDMKYGSLAIDQNSEDFSEASRINLAKMALAGDVFTMDENNATVLYERFFTNKVYSKNVRMLQKVLKFGRNLYYPLIMSNPLQLPDRVINFTGFDYGVLGKANASTTLYMGTSIATVNKLFAMAENPNTNMENAFASDPNMALLARYIAQSAYDPTKEVMYNGEKVKTTKIPGLRELSSIANKAFGKQNLYARFAYFMAMTKEAEKNGGDLNYAHSGAAYHLREGLSELTGNTKLSNVYKMYETSEAQRQANNDARIAEIIDQNLGSVNGMPYGAKVLSDFGICFTTFPLAIGRWAKNSMLSLGSMFQNVDGTALKYAISSGIGTVVASIVTLGIQLLASESLRKKLFSDEELTEEEEENARNILFRGGSVKMIQSFMRGKEVVADSQSRGAGYSLFDMTAANFLPMFRTKEYNSDGTEKEQNFFTDFLKFLQTQVASKAPVVIKDTAEVLGTSTPYWQPEETISDSLQKKVMGYIFGSTQANTIMDSFEIDENDPEAKTFGIKLANGLANAYTIRNSSNSEYKSQFKNYKKALSLTNEYIYAMSDQSEENVIPDNSYISTAEKTEYKEDSTSLRAELLQALKFGKSADTVYNIIVKYIQAGMSYSNVLYTLQKVSLKNKIANCDQEKLYAMLSEADIATIKSALEYEDDIFPFLDDIYNDIVNKRNEEYASQYNSAYNNYSLQWENLLSQLTYNSKKAYTSSYSNRSNYYNYGVNNYDFASQYLYTQMKNYEYKKANAVKNAVTNVKKKLQYGKAYDIQGNQYYRSTNGSDNWTWYKDDSQ